MLHSVYLRWCLLFLGVVLWFVRPEANQIQGLTAHYYNDISFRQLLFRRIVQNLEISMDGLPQSARQINYSIRYQGYLSVPEAGLYWFQLDSDDGSELFIDGQSIVSNLGLHGRRQRRGKTRLASGSHSIEITYQQGHGDSFFAIRWKPPTHQAFQEIPRDRLTVVEPERLNDTKMPNSLVLRVVLGILASLLVLSTLAQWIWLEQETLEQLLRSWWSRLSFGAVMANSLVQDVFCALLCLLVYANNVAQRLPSEPYMIGDSPYYANIALSILYDFDLDQRNQTEHSIFEDPKPTSNIPMNISNISLGRGGQWYPKHPILAPFLAIPFYIVWGGFGFIVFNLTTFCLLIALMRRVALIVCSPPAACVAAIFVGLSPVFIDFAYSFSTDSVASVFVLASFVLFFKKKFIPSGLCLGLAVWAKLPNLLLVVVSLGSLLLGRHGSQALHFGIGLGLPLLTLASFNWYQFGAPWITAYQRVLVIEQGISKIGNHTEAFSRPLLEGFHLQLFTLRHGLLNNAPAVLISILGYKALFKRAPETAWTIGLFILFTLLFYANYNFHAGHDSIRFLMPIIVLSVLPLACLLERLNTLR